MKKLFLFISSLFLMIFTVHSVAKSQKPNVHSPHIQIKIYQKTTQNPKRKIHLQYSLLTSKSAPAKHLNALIDKLLQSKVQTFMKDSAQSSRNFTSTLQIDDEILFYNPKKLISIQYIQYVFFAGAAHPNTAHFVLNYDITSGKVLQLKDILENPEKDLKFISDFSIKKLMAKKLGPKSFIKEGASPNFKNYQNWNFTDRGFVIVFDPYQVAAYALGPQKIIIPYALLKGRIKPRYYRMLVSDPS